MLCLTAAWQGHSPSREVWAGRSALPGSCLRGQELPCALLRWENWGFVPMQRHQPHASCIRISILVLMVCQVNDIWRVSCITIHMVLCYVIYTFKLYVHSYVLASGADKNPDYQIHQSSGNKNNPISFTSSCHHRTFQMSDTWLNLEEEADTFSCDNSLQ